MTAEAVAYRRLTLRGSAADGERGDAFFGERRLRCREAGVGELP